MLPVLSRRSGMVMGLPLRSVRSRSLVLMPLRLRPNTCCTAFVLGDRRLPHAGAHG